MRRVFYCFVLFIVVSSNLFARENSNRKQALEVESLFPMFITGGFHAGVGYRCDKFRIRVSVINGGKYNAEKAGLKNSSPDFKRYYTTSPGLFLGYNVWRDLEVYTFFEFHTFEIEQTSTGVKRSIQCRLWRRNRVSVFCL